MSILSQWRAQLEGWIFARLRQVYAKASEREFHSISQELQRQAVQSTAVYVQQHASAAKPLKSREAVLQYASENVARQLLASGMIAEFGVYSGITITLIAQLFPDKRLYGFDSFQGLPEDWRPGFEKGTFARSTLPSVPKNVELVVGWFNDTLPTFVRTHKKQPLALLHLDADLYSSALTVLNALKAQIVPGTILVFDEYWNYPGWENGEFRAWQEFCEVNDVGYEYLAYTDDHEQVALRVLTPKKAPRKVRRGKKS